MIDWCFLGAERFTDSFFDQTIGRCLRLPFNHLFRPQTPVETLLARAAGYPGLSPTGFIFHMSRCGSTLVSQMLAALSENIVISEAGPIDAMMRACYRTKDIEPAEQISWIRAIVSALAQPNHGGQKRLFIKFDCINTLSLPLIRQAFPKTPWIFLFRNPVEVLVSQFRLRGGLLLPGALEPALLGLEVSVLGQLTMNEYCAALLGKICEAGLDHFHGETGLLVDYRQLPDVVESSIAAHFGLCYSPEEIERMRQVTPLHAKNPHFQFTGDSETKQREATAEVHRLVERWLAGPCARLEARRRSQDEATGRIGPQPKLD